MENRHFREELQVSYTDKQVATYVESLEQNTRLSESDLMVDFLYQERLARDAERDKLLDLMLSVYNSLVDETDIPFLRPIVEKLRVVLRFHDKLLDDKVNVQGGADAQ